MHIRIAVIFLFISTICSAQISLKVFSEPADDGIAVFAANAENCPVSVQVNFQIQNMAAASDQNIFVVPPKTEKHKLVDLKIIDKGKGYQFNFRFLQNYGDITLKQYDAGYVYDLPFRGGEGYRVVQGYNGRFSHFNENAIDFTMPEGTPVVAAREGVVVKVEQGNNRGCPGEECKTLNNSVIIYHPDGTMAEYAHLQFNGARVKPGDQVKKGQLIAYSGNTGWSSGPHLHFVVFLPGMESRRSVPTVFRISRTETGQLSEGAVYKKDY